MAFLGTLKRKHICVSTSIFVCLNLFFFFFIEEAAIGCIHCYKFVFALQSETDVADRRLKAPEVGQIPLLYAAYLIKFGICSSKMELTEDKEHNCGEKWLLQCGICHTVGIHLERFSVTLF